MMFLGHENDVKCIDYKKRKINTIIIYFFMRLKKNVILAVYTIHSCNVELIKHSLCSQQSYQSMPHFKSNHGQHHGSGHEVPRCLQDSHGSWVFYQRGPSGKYNTSLCIILFMEDIASFLCFIRLHHCSPSVICTVSIKRKCLRGSLDCLLSYKE